MRGLLVNLHFDSSVGGKGASGNGTAEVAGLVIIPDMIDQTFLCLHRLGTLATTPSGEVAMLVTDMGSELRSNKKHTF